MAAIGAKCPLAKEGVRHKAKEQSMQQAAGTRALPAGTASLGAAEPAQQGLAASNLPCLCRLQLSTVQDPPLARKSYHRACSSQQAATNCKTVTHRRDCT